MGHVVITQPKGDKHVMSDSTLEFWETHNARNHPDFHVRITQFDGDDSEKKATEFALKKEPDYVPVNKAALEKVEAKIRSQVEKEVQDKAQEAIDKAAKENEAKLKKLQEKLDKLENKNGSK